MSLSSAQLALLGLCQGVRPVDPFKCDQDTLHVLWNDDYIDVSWDNAKITITDKGRKAWESK